MNTLQMEIIALFYLCGCCFQKPSSRYEIQSATIGGPGTGQQRDISRQDWQRLRVLSPQQPRGHCRVLG